jgi:hypothetical protein
MKNVKSEEFENEFALTIELVPKTSWYTNVRSHVSPEEWDIIRKKSYTFADNKCEICGDNGTNQGVRHRVECHEIWHYDDEKKKQTLKGMISLCPNCHKTKHVGLAQLRGEEDIVVRQLMKVNNMTEDEAYDYIDRSGQKWIERSQYDWELDISILNEYK